MTPYQITTAEKLADSVTAAGSYYFSPGTMRFFNSSVRGVFPAIDRVYFVERRGGGRWEVAIPSHYIVGVFRVRGDEVICQALGHGPYSARAYIYETSANDVARKLATKRRRSINPKLRSVP